MPCIANAIIDIIYSMIENNHRTLKRFQVDWGRYTLATAIFKTDGGRYTV
jgi:hypothetical protein